MKDLLVVVVLFVVLAVVLIADIKITERNKQ
jgi:hypothetical protein